MTKRHAVLRCRLSRDAGAVALVVAGLRSQSADSEAAGPRLLGISESLSQLNSDPVLTLLSQCRLQSPNSEHLLSIYASN